MTAPATVFVDGDACPVKDETVRIAQRHNLLVVIVSNGGLRPSRDPMIRHIVVPKGADAADDWIVGEAMPGDVVVTADILLAARLVAKDVQVLSPTGKHFTSDSIGMAVAMRDLKQHLRETGEIRGLNPGFSKEDRSRFLGELDKLTRRARLSKGQTHRDAANDCRAFKPAAEPRNREAPASRASATTD